MLRRKNTLHALIHISRAIHTQTLIYRTYPKLYAEQHSTVIHNKAKLKIVQAEPCGNREFIKTRFCRRQLFGGPLTIKETLRLQVGYRESLSRVQSDDVD